MEQPTTTTPSPASPPVLIKAKAPAVKKPAKTAKPAEQTDAAPSLRDQATAKAHELAEVGRDKASAMLENLTALTDDVAAKMRERFGDKYPDYLADMAGKMAAMAVDLRAKDVDQMVENTREFVRKRPAVAIGAAAAAGFLLARLVKSGNGAASEPSDTGAA